MKRDAGCRRSRRPRQGGDACVPGWPSLCDGRVFGFARCLRCICGSVMWFVLAVWGEVPWLMVMSSTPRISVTTRLGPDASSFARSPRFHLPICRRRCVSVPEGGSQGTYFLCILVWFWYQLMLASNCVRGHPLPSPCKISVLASLDV